jgi:hypothetical protein
MDLAGNTPSVPSVRVPDHCEGSGEILIEGGMRPFAYHNAAAYFVCAGINEGVIRELYKSERMLINGSGEGVVSEQQLEQIGKLAEAGIRALCLNCPLNPKNQDRDSAGGSDKVISLAERRRND